MTIAQSLLPEFDHEMATTRSLLERVPAANAEWKPHSKSMSLGQLAVHIATLPIWSGTVLTETEFDVNPADGPNFTPPQFESTEGLLGLFDESVGKARAALADTSDADIMAKWALKNRGHQIFSLPRVAVLRSFIMNHMIHHRGQLSVYLRLNDVPLPSIYGPTADTPM